MPLYFASLSNVYVEKDILEAGGVIERLLMKAKKKI
jgi:hypothetical protein